jgi:hypothetical protein
MTVPTVTGDYKEFGDGAPPACAPSPLRSVPATRNASTAVSRDCVGCPARQAPPTPSPAVAVRAELNHLHPLGAARGAAATAYANAARRERHVPPAAAFAAPAAKDLNETTSFLNALICNLLKNANTYSVDPSAVNADVHAEIKKLHTTLHAVSAPHALPGPSDASYYFTASTASADEHAEIKTHYTHLHAASEYCARNAIEISTVGPVDCFNVINPSLAAISEHAEHTHLHAADGSHATRTPFGITSIYPIYTATATADNYAEIKQPYTHLHTVCNGYPATFSFDSFDFQRSDMPPTAPPTAPTCTNESASSTRGQQRHLTRRVLWAVSVAMVRDITSVVKSQQWNLV